MISERISSKILKEALVQQKEIQEERKDSFSGLFSADVAGVEDLDDFQGFDDIQSCFSDNDVSFCFVFALQRDICCVNA